MNSQMYDKNFYDNQVDGSVKSGLIILEYLFQFFKPKSMIDFGCGRGSWLYAAEKLGVERLVGLDGDWVDQSSLLPEKMTFHQIDFTKLTADFGKFDLAVSVEVAEHFEEQYSQSFIERLSNHSDSIVFGAARPGQGGTNHVNEQEQSYWIDKFKGLGYQVYDLIRPAVWQNKDVEFWYSQNTFFFTKDVKVIQSLPREMPFLSDVIHPDLFNKRCVKGNAKREKADILRDAALELENEDIHLAINLLEMAHTARPHGKYILEKLEEFRSRLLCQ